MSEKIAPLRIAILVFPHVTASTVYGMYDLFMGVGRDWGFVTQGAPGPSLIEPVIVSARAGAITAANSIELSGYSSALDFPAPQVVCVPDLAIAPDEGLQDRFDPELAYLRAAYGQGATIATACAGALLLAGAGLLAGFQATTHWAYAEYFREHYPDIQMHPRRALVVSGNDQRLVMAGGGTSWMDLALLLVARLCSVEEAMRVARLLLIDWHSDGQQPFALLAHRPQKNDAVIADCQAWIAEHYALASPVALMVERSGLAERSFKRRFQQATGMSPLEYVHTLRLEEAKQMLERSGVSIEAIANEVGYEDAGFFNRLFRRHVGLTPAAYRKRFGSLRQALTSGDFQRVG